MEAAGALSRAAHAGDHLRRAGQRAVGPARGGRAVRPPRDRRRRGSRAGRGRGGTRRCSQARRWARCTGCRPRRGTRSGCAAVVAIGSVAPYVAPVEPGASPFYDVGAAGSVAAFCAQRGLPDYRAFVEYFMGEAITEPHRTKPVEDAVGWGLETTPEVLALTVAAREGRDQGGVRGRVPGGALPGAGGARRRGRDHPVRARCGAGRAAGRRARHARGRRPPAVARRPGALQPVDPGVRRRAGAHAGAAAAVEPGAAQAPSRARGVLADRARARPPRRRDRRRAARAAPRPGRAVAGPAPGHGGAGRARRERAPGVGRCWPGSRRTWSRRRASTTCTSSRPTGAWTRSWSPTSWSSTTS